MTTIVLFFFVALLNAEIQETRPVPAGSVEIGARGCLTGRVFTATPRPEDEGVVLGPDVTGRNFRVSGPRAILDLVRKYDGNLVEVFGRVRQADLAKSGPGVTISAPRTDPTRKNVRTTPAGGLPVMDVTGIRFLSDVCPIN
jgi:hypothetical protein